MNSKNYDQEFKATILELLGTGRTVKSLSDEYGVSQASISRWKRMSKTSGSINTSLGGEENQRIKALEKELKDVKLERDIPKKGGKHLFQERQVIYGFIKDHRGRFPVGKMCKCMRVSKNAYYTWLRAGQGCRPNSGLDGLKERIREVYHGSNRIYGSSRIQKVLERQGVFYSKSYIALLMKKMGLKSILSRKFRVTTTDSGHSFPIAENLLGRDFTSDSLGEKWVSDITYIKIGNGWNYLTTILDLADRKVLSWVLSEDMTVENTVYKAWSLARKRREITDNHLFHSDQGSQYACHRMVSLFYMSPKITQSMSRKGNCWDNAVAESFFKTIKYECIYRHSFKSYLQAYQIIENYIQWYNNVRIHSALDFKTPAEKELELKIKKMYNVA
ncbi:IS3 family transposase [Galbibacter sp. BG1]|uniref:IS3 family transposase n=1 Tax=Galbibacter sp. BG1 TaxID=1170699 RepID=UPI0015BA1C71|nr:IS3 family transposase [Galbibacter sp. BG1]QLE00935.1 IS3 family transposase [Galbibacter sp. BG1]QLE01131.1 IS3 family transposase [Galbibacter sp. BG1]